MDGDAPSLQRFEDGKAFNDPTAWGYCEFCTRLVAVDDNSIRIEHRYARNGANTEICCGSYKPAVTPVPLEATPRKRVSLYKHVDRQRKRANAQRSRTNQRARTRAKVSVKPVSVVLNGTDITDQIVGDVTLSME